MSEFSTMPVDKLFEVLLVNENLQVIKKLGNYHQFFPMPKIGEHIIVEGYKPNPMVKNIIYDFDNKKVLIYAS